MKVIRGGGGVDKDGNTYKLPDEEIELPDDAFDQALRETMKAPRPDFVPRAPGAWEIIRKMMANKRS